MVMALHDHVSILQSFLSSSTSATPQSAAEATFHIARAAATSAAPKPAVALAQTVLTILSQKPCPPAIPHLLSICERDPFEALDVFVLSSAAWKALVAAAIVAPLDPQLSMRVISCAALNATGMIARCFQSPTHTSSELTRTVKIAKFYCLNAARCSRAFRDSATDISPQILAAPFLKLCDFLSLSSFVLLFDHHALPPAHNELQSEILPIATKALKTVLSMTRSFSRQDILLVVERVLQCTGSNPTFTTLNLPSPVLQLLSTLHLSRCFVDINDTKEESLSSQPVCRSVFATFLLPALFDCFDAAYEEILIFRERDGGSFLDTVTAATADCVSAFAVNALQTDKGSVVVDFLLEQVSSENAIRSLIAQDALTNLSSLPDVKNGWRHFTTASVLACFRSSLLLDCAHAPTRWERLAVKLCVLYVQDGEALTEVLVSSRELCGMSESERDGTFVDSLHDPIMIPLIAQMQNYMSWCGKDNTAIGSDSRSQTQKHSVLRVSGPFQVDFMQLTTRARDLARTAVGYSSENGIALLPHLLDSKPAFGTAMAVLRRESSTPGMVCTALNALDPFLLEPSAISDMLLAAIDAVRNHGAVVCPAVSALVSRAASFLGEAVPFAQWQEMCSVLETCLKVSQESDTVEPVRDALAGAVLHHAATALSGARKLLGEERQTQMTLPSSILSDVEDALGRLRKWGSDDIRCDLEQERYLVRGERHFSGHDTKREVVGGEMGVVRSIREAKEHLLDALSMLMDEKWEVNPKDEFREEFSLLQESMKCIARCVTSP